jgi:protein required for attachment to host cells
MKTWVVVASAARARIFESRGGPGALREIEDLVSPEERLEAHELKSDRPGRAFDHLGGQRHAMGTAVDPKEQLAIRFAKQVVDRLAADRHAHRFDALCVVAPPHFLGLLRGGMDAGLARSVKGELTHDLTRQDLRSLEARVAHLL